MKIRSMRIECWITKARNTHTEYVILIAFPLQQCLDERISLLLRYSILSVFFRSWVKEMQISKFKYCLYDYLDSEKSGGEK